MKVKLVITTGYVGADHVETQTIPDADVAGMNEDQLDDYISEYWLQPMRDNHIDMYWEKVEDEDEA